jgi:hypothetical protein
MMGDEMRSALLSICVLILCCSFSAECQIETAVKPVSNEAKADKGPAEPMRGIVDALAGTWTITWAGVDGQVIGNGREIWRMAPGGTAFVEENRSKVNGKYADDYAVMWWDSKAQRVHGIWCDGSINDEGCSGFDAMLKGEEVILTGEWEFQQKRQAWREVFSSRKGAMAMKQTLYVGEPGKDLKLASMIAGVRR